MRITGSKKKRDEFEEFAKGFHPEWKKEKYDDQLGGDGIQKMELIMCNNFIPVPDEILKKGYSHAGYDFCCRAWGTKWGCYDTRVNHTKTSTVYSFNSAWSPPVPVVYAMAKKFPELTFNLYYREGGACYQGRLILKGEEVIRDWEADYNGHYGG